MRVSAGVLSHAEGLAAAGHVLPVLCVVEFCAAQAVLRAGDAVSGMWCCCPRVRAASSWCSLRVFEGSFGRAAARGVARSGRLGWRATDLAGPHGHGTPKIEFQRMKVHDDCRREQHVLHELGSLNLQAHEERPFMRHVFRKLMSDAEAAQRWP